MKQLSKKTTIVGFFFFNCGGKHVLTLFDFVQQCERFNVITTFSNGLFCSWKKECTGQLIMALRPDHQPTESTFSRKKKAAAPSNHTRICSTTLFSL